MVVFHCYVSSLPKAKFHGTMGTQHLHSPPSVRFPCRRTFWPMAHPRPPVRRPVMMEYQVHLHPGNTFLCKEKINYPSWQTMIYFPKMLNASMLFTQLCYQIIWLCLKTDYPLQFGSVIMRFLLKIGPIFWYPHFSIPLPRHCPQQFRHLSDPSPDK